MRIITIEMPSGMVSRGREIKEEAAANKTFESWLTTMKSWPGFRAVLTMKENGSILHQEVIQ